MKIIGICLMGLVLFSCVEFKNTQAVKRVTANRDLLDIAFYEGLKIHPCANDTTIVTKKDTAVRFDTIVDRKNDTIFVKTIKTVTLRDTVKISIIDQLKLNILNDTINNKNKVIANQDGQIVILRDTIKALKKDKLKLLGVIGIFILGGLTMLYLKLKK